MKKIRVTARIDVKNEFVIKGIHLEGLRKVGDPNLLAKKYYEEGIDEIIFMDAVAAYYDRNSLSHIIEKACKEVFIPITVGGGLRTIDDINQALKAGADKVAINTKAIQNPEFIAEASKIFGSQCIVASIVAKKINSNQWEAYIDNGREATGLDIVEWAKRLEGLGAGEIMLTSLDMEGTKKGFDTELYEAVQDVVSIPIIASGGMGNIKHAVELLSNYKIDAIATASVIHYNIDTIKNIKQAFIDNNIKVRM
ncbi:MAG: imidazole glycerol phosphate synthase cyclase subunit [Sulfurimonas sp.]|uniref:imidazole glycerol phosphate synthase subunit HisF n=1 Tax=Sulfurimonas sp. TaxID=2022749 RepID=UPI0025EE2519|nr:imidazole glycerol phosphate synthase cyclase subunit [Sulfurimonas sp.]MCK9491400.1 imidazole glycerol phosphate synthase cyclase subunit [Sulfurimonas sp.]